MAAKDLTFHTQSQPKVNTQNQSHQPPSRSPSSEDQSTSTNRHQQPSNQSSTTSVSHSPPIEFCQTILSFATMEIAYKELQHTLDEATAYRQSPELHPQHLRLHIEALREDTDLLNTYETGDPELRTLAVRLAHAAKRMRRHLERDLIDLQIAGKDDTQNSTRHSPVKRPNTVQLTPIQLPSFDGTATQFRVYQNFFEENVINNSDLTDTAKWIRLKQSLSGQPAEVISEIPQTEHTLKLAWKLLVEIYGGDERPVVDLYNKLQNLSPSTLATDRLRITHSKLEGLILSLEGLGHDADVNHFIKWTYMGKFPAEILYQVQTKKDTPLKEIRQAIGEVIASRECTDLQRRTTAACSADLPRKGAPAPTVVDTDRKPTPSKKPANFPKPLKCTFCEGQHWNDQCTVYSTIPTRTAKLTGKCLKCLRTAHSSPCAEERRCYHCDSLDHNRALCPTKFATPRPATSQTQLAILPDKTEVKTGNFLTCMVQATSKFTDRKENVRLVVDTAAGATLATERLVHALNVPVSKGPVSYYTGLNDVQLTSSQTLNGTIDLLTSDGETISVEAAMIGGSIPDVPTANITEFRRINPQYAHIDIPNTGEGHPIDLLIGSDSIVDILKAEKINAINADTLLLPTKLGYFIVGRRRQQKDKVCPSMLIKHFSNPLQQLSDLDIVGLAGIDQSDIDEEEKAIQQFYASVRFVDHRYSISWPWRTYPPQLDSNFGLALGRLKSLYKRLLKSPSLLRDYDAIIQQQLQQGIIEKATMRSQAAVIHYLPHHPIIQPEKSTVIRPVIDGSSKTSTKSKSLNDNIRKGTKWLNDLIATLIRMRQHKNVVIADIARAFHQISINDGDRDAARFLWLKKLDEPPTETNLEIFRFTRVAFGIIASPFLLSAVLKHHANQQEPNPFTNVILKNMYADNLVASLDESIDPEQFYAYTKKFFASMSMNMTKWSTNVQKLQLVIPDDDRTTELILAVLGIRWHINKDTLLLKQPKMPLESRPTPRTVARDMAAHFDPLGWASPVTLTAKIFFRAIWEKLKGWDQPLQEEDAQNWSQIHKSLKHIDSIELPRQLTSLPNPNRQQIHTFVDASIEAYAIVVYVRTVTEEKSETRIVIAKSRLTPKKKITIPKLELIALLLGCRLTKFVRDTLECTTKTEEYIWSDSKCAIAWMTQNKILPPAVEKQIAEAKKCNVANFKYVPSELNFADVATRGAEVSTLKQMSWWDGPTWLNNADNWPQQNSQPIPEIQTVLQFQQITYKTTRIAETEIEGIATLNVQEFSSLHSLLLRTAFCFHALIKFKRNNFLRLQSRIDTAVALQWWLYWDQKREYALQAEPEAGKTFVLRNLTVFRDSDDIIRCQTRILNSCAELDTVNPILLVPKSTLTKLIIMDLHKTHMHAGTSHTLANLRRTYWLPHGRREIYNTILKNCLQCRRHTAQPYPTPPPAPLPEFRVTRTKKPFQAIGLDICGPFFTRKILGRNQPKQKKWIILFTCAVVRAVHLELLNEMTTLEILLAFRRFSARRGIPRIILSDNAPQFRLLDSCFKDIWHDLAQDDVISSYLAKHKIIWKFITETAPWMGGMYERLIQSIKQALEKTYGTVIMLDRQFETTMVEIEAIINSRPIAYVDREAESPILTPNDFLTATHVALPIQEVGNPEDDLLKKMWKSSQTYLNTFWKQWSDNYLLLLRDRNDQLHRQTRYTNKQPQKGDIVVMIDLSKKKSCWRTAVVERLIPGNDNKIRSLQIRLPNNIRLIKPVISLAPLNLTMDLPEISDEQLNVGRNAIIHSPVEGATQSHLNPDLEQTEDEEMEEELDEEQEEEEQQREREIP